MLKTYNTDAIRICQEFTEQIQIYDKRIDSRLSENSETANLCEQRGAYHMKEGV